MKTPVKNRQNIIVICTDQQRTDTLSCYGSKFLNTPGFDRIADDGIRYDRAYCTSAVCTPSRVSLLSGQYVSRHNIWSIGVNTGDDVTMVQHRLSDVGYHTGLIGKAHLEAYGAPKDQSNESIAGFEQGYGDWDGPYYGFSHVRLALGHVNYGMTGHYGAWLRQTFSEEEIEEFKTLRPVSNRPEFGGEAYRSMLPQAFHNSVWTVDGAVEFLETKTDDDPFFLFVSFQDPHHPHALPEDHVASVRAEMVPEPNYTENELNDKPPHFRLAREGKLPGSRFLGAEYPMSGQGEGHDFRDVDAQSARDGRSHYYSMVGLIDEQLQKLWKELEDRGLYDDTLIIVTSDHGELLGDHGLWMKGPFHYDEIVRIPLLIKPPIGAEYEAGTSCPDVVSLVDVVPTCLAAAGIDNTGDDIDGIDLLKTSRPSERTVFVETTQDWHSLVCKSAITSTHKLTWYAEEAFGELYDAETDLQEKTNLWEDPGSAELKTKLVSKLLDMQIKTGRSQKIRISYA